MECNAEVVAEAAQCFALLFAGTRQSGRAVRGGFEKHGGLAADDVHVNFFGGAGVAYLRQLQHFAFGDDASSLRDDSHDFHRAQLDHHFERTGIEKVTDQYTGRIAPQGIGG